jgi:cell division protein FtsZ
VNNIEEIEKEPAYKRQGINLNENPKGGKVSRTSLGEDSNDEIQLRSNNSFLHDNVD